MTIIVPVPWSRVNDQFVRTDRIDATPIKHNIGHPLVTSEHGDVDSKSFADFYKHIAVDIVTESVFNYPYPFISEKTLRPFNCKRMFIILGPAYMLKTLHDKGFETFGDIIDESYDSIEDPEERFLAVIQEIERFCQRDLEEIKQYYRDNQSKFEHNFNRLPELHREELEQLRSTL